MKSDSGSWNQDSKDRSSIYVFIFVDWSVVLSVHLFININIDIDIDIERRRPIEQLANGSGYISRSRDPRDTGVVEILGIQE